MALEFNELQIQRLAQILYRCMEDLGSTKAALYLAAPGAHRFQLESIRLVSVTLPDSTQKPLILGESFKAEIVLDLCELSPEDIGIEILFGKKVNDEVKEPVFIREMAMAGAEKHVVTYTCDIPFNQAGVYDFTLRIFPKNPELPHRQDLSIVKYI